MRLILDGTVIRTRFDKKAANISVLAAIGVRRDGQNEFRRRIKTQTALPCAETVPMLLWALLASGQIQMRKVDGC